MPTKHDNGICISMIIFQPHKAREVYSKKYIHPDEEPFFIRGENYPVLKVKENNIGFAICYELTIPQHSENAFNNGAEIYIASVAKSANGVEKAEKTLSEIAGKYSMPVLFSNCLGPSDDFVSAGKTSVWNNRGLLLRQLNDTDEGIIIYDTVTQDVIEKIL